MRKNRLMNHKGQVIIYVTLIVVVLILIVGIAIDGGIGMAVKAKLHSAVDAATIAGGRVIGEGGSDTERINKATEAARKFFYANFPEGYLRATPAAPNVIVEQVIEDDGTWHGKWRVEVTGEATVPTFFLRIAGNKTFTASALAETLRRDLDMALVVDVSDSLSPVDNDVKDAVEAFVDEFNKESDRLALISFATGAVVNEPIRQVERGFDKSEIIDDINSLNFDGYTNFGEGFWNGLDQLNSVNPANRSSLRALVFFTDGSPNTFASTFTFTYSGNPQRTGSLRTCKNPPCGPYGLYRHDRIYQQLPWPYYRGSNIGNYLQQIPPFYNAHGVDEDILCPSTRNGHSILCSDVNDSNTINRIARNLPESMADRARSQGIIVYTIGLQGSGCHMTGPSGPDGEIGQDILKRMANTTDSDTYSPDQPSGLFCLAETSTTSCPPTTGPIYDLDGCFEAVASHILQLTR